jgi:hypothetical protein
MLFKRCLSETIAGGLGIYLKKLSVVEKTSLLTLFPVRTFSNDPRIF